MQRATKSLKPQTSCRSGILPDWFKGATPLHKRLEKVARRVETNLLAQFCYRGMRFGHTRLDIKQIINVFYVVFYSSFADCLQSQD